MIRPIRLTDIPGLKLQQHVVPLNLPECAVRNFSPARFGARSSLRIGRAGANGLVYTSRMRPIAACLYHSPRHSEAARLTALSSLVGAGDRALAAWERLIERTCLRAAGDGKLRVLARPEDGSECARLLHRLGFTVATREHVLVKAADGHTGPERAGRFERLERDDVWDAWKLYNRTEPVTAQRAEGLTPASWWREHRARRGPREGWVLRVGGDVAVHQELLYGKKDAALTLHFEPEHRGVLPDAVDHALAVCAARQVEKLYCVVREHQAELEGLLLERGFRLARSQVRLVLYTSVLSYSTEAARLAAAEKVPAAFPGFPGLSRGIERGASQGLDWYNIYDM